MIDVGVAYKEDVDHVMDVLKDIGSELSTNPTVGPMILEPLEVLGVDNFGDSHCSTLRNSEQRTRYTPDFRAAKGALELPPNLE